MAIVLDGTTGITTPGLTNTGTETLVNLTTTGNTTLGDATTDTLTVGVTGIVKDASGNVGIGTASPSVKFEVSGTAVAVARISSSQTSPNNILMTGGSSYNYGVIGVNTGNNTSGGDVFQLGYTASAGAAPTSVLQWSSAAKCIGLNTTPATSGTGITFPATQSASTDANTLDDYEEGTWTPTWSVSGGTISAVNNEGYYTKIGRQVFVGGYIGYGGSVTGSPSGTLSIAGLPFTSNATGYGQSGGRQAGRGPAGFGFWGVTPTIQQLYVANNSSSLVTPASYSDMSRSFSNSDQIYFFVTYFV